MKIFAMLMSVVFSFLLQNNVWGISIVYNDLGCLNAGDTNDPTPNNVPIQSKFEVIDSLGDGIYRLRLTGGIPRFVNNNHIVCIDNTTALGYTGIGEVDVIPRLLESTDATAFFNGKDLIISVNSIYTDLSANRNQLLSTFSTSRIFVFTNTLIFEFNPGASLFRLKKVIRNRGFTHTSGSINLLTPFFETVLPSLNDEVLDKPKILTPVSDIEFAVE